MPTLLLLGYNELAFGSPFDFGYFHHATPIFRKVHHAGNPLGLTLPRGTHALARTLGRLPRALLLCAILLLSIPGWCSLLAGGTGVGIVSFTTALVVYGVDLSYPEWTGGWSTGPRLLVPLLPFAMAPVAGLLALPIRGVTWAAIGLTLAGAVIILLFQGAGGRIPNQVQVTRQAIPSPLEAPLCDAVWPLCTAPPFPWASNGRFARNVVSLLLPRTLAELPESSRWVQFLPLVVAQLLAIGAMSRIVPHQPGVSR